VVAGVLFDTGDTLTRPIGGRWNPRFDFEEVLLRHVPDANESRFRAAFAEGERFLDRSTSTPSRDDYHRAVLAVLGIDPSHQLLADLDRRLEHPVVEVFPDVVPVLDHLQQRGLRMAMVTDGWGNAESVKQKHDRLGIGHYFEAFVVSSELGCTKPDPRMFHTASTALGLAPPQCLFVDDSPGLVAAAIRLGYGGVAIRRQDNGPSMTVPVIRGLAELLDHL
jgi:putative hydrolase of the HAD superfamily